MKRKRVNKGSNTKVAIFFVGFVISIIIVSLIFKFVVILRQSKFDTSKRFTVTISDNKNSLAASF
mgnify:CR=1 FL=1